MVEKPEGRGLYRPVPLLGIHLPLWTILVIVAVIVIGVPLTLYVEGQAESKPLSLPAFLKDGTVIFNPPDGWEAVRFEDWEPPPAPTQVYGVTPERGSGNHLEW